MNEQSIKMAIDIMINKYNKNKEQFANNMLTEEKENTYIQYMPIDLSKPDIKCIKIELKIKEEVVNFGEILKYEIESEEK